MTADDSIQSLTALGFTGLEAEVYTALLKASSATAYRIAQAIGKPAANVYKAVESLANKGAVLVDEAESRVCRPVPPDELLARLSRTFADQRDRAARALARLGETAADDRIYQMRTTEQVFERARRMLERAARVAVVDLFPEPLEALRPDITRAIARGLAVAVKAYAPVDLPGADVVVMRRGADVLGRWPGQWLNVVVDGSEHLLAFLAPEGERVYQAVWSGSAYLSWVYHSALTSEHSLAALENLLLEREQADDVREVLEQVQRRRWLEAPGYRALLARFGTATPDEEGSRQ